MMIGDMTNSGDAESHVEARRILDRLPMPWHVMMGNHDGRDDAARRVEVSI